MKITMLFYEKSYDAWILFQKCNPIMAAMMNVYILVLDYITSKEFAWVQRQRLSVRVWQTRQDILNDVDKGAVPIIELAIDS